jgi:hypothetical protein
MSLSRRSFLMLLSAAGVSISANEWLLSRLESEASAGTAPIIAR